MCIDLELRYRLYEIEYRLAVAAEAGPAERETWGRLASEAKAAWLQSIQQPELF